MKSATLDLGGGMKVYSNLDWNGRYFIVYAKSVSFFVRYPKDLPRALGLPTKTPSRDTLAAWLAEIETADTERKTERAKVDLEQTWGPEGHLDKA